MVDDVVYGAFVAALVHVDVYHAFAYRQLFLYLDYLVAAVAVEYDNVVERGAVAYKLVFFQGCADEAFLAVDI